MYVYVIEAQEVQRVKIGTARRPHFRLAALQVGSPVKLRLAEVLCFGKGVCCQVEQLAKKRLLECRAIGEWFDVDTATALAAISAAARELNLQLPRCRFVAESDETRQGATYSAQNYPI
jgi:hypothetical protein